MTFSTVKIGTIEDVKEAIRNHHSEHEGTLAYLLVHESANKALTSIATKSLSDNVQLCISGHSHINDAGNLSFSYSVSLEVLDETNYEALKLTYSNQTDEVYQNLFVSELKLIETNSE